VWRRNSSLTLLSSFLLSSDMIRPQTLAAWLAYLETLHPKAIAMGLDRVAEVHSRLDAALACPVITVAGTNGKGSTCALLESMLRAAGYRVGLYMSPHLLAYNERMRLGGEIVGDAALVTAFNAVEDARTSVPLTYFEYGTLAALWLYARANLDAIVLEVGLGGRLDAVNVVDADVAVITSIDFDHMEYLGPTREDIGREKAGIFRAGRRIVCGEPDPPRSLTEHAQVLGAPISRIGRDYGYTASNNQWEYWGPGGARHGLPHPSLRGPIQLVNAATAITALDCLRERVHVAAGAIRDGLVAVDLPGRFQALAGRPTIVLDVAHNPQAARVFAAALGTMAYHPRTTAVFGMFTDKDIAGVAHAIRARVDRWHVAGLPGPRGASAATVRMALESAGVLPSAIRVHDTVAAAFDHAREETDEADRIIVFGSFLTVGAAMAAANAGMPHAPPHG
jgi:dihydrofolate synthase/folylpolyglutamate synthase